MLKEMQDPSQFKAYDRDITQMNEQFSPSSLNTTPINRIENVVNNNTLSGMELKILRSNVPVEISAGEEILFNGQKGIWINKDEVLNWNGSIPIDQYPLNQDSKPIIIHKNNEKKLEYVQELAIRYLRPPTPPCPGEILIKQEPSIIPPSAPPLVIRYQPTRPVTPEPLIVREAPPAPPLPIGRKIIIIRGKNLPPPPRKVIIERLAPIPSKPQPLIIERWLPYNTVKRKVIFQSSNQKDPVPFKPKNVIIQWDTPKILIKKEIKDLGVIRANPADYVARYGKTLKKSKELPLYVHQIIPPDGIKLAAEQETKKNLELEGDVHALNLIDLEKEGLSEYRSYVQKINQLESSFKRKIEIASKIDEILASIKFDLSSGLSVKDAKNMFLKLNFQLNLKINENEIHDFLTQLYPNCNRIVDLISFRKAFHMFFENSI